LLDKEFKDGGKSFPSFLVSNRQNRGDSLVTYSKKIWKKKEITTEEEIQKIAKELDVSQLFVEICMQRGLKTAADIRQFISIDETWFHDPFLLNDMEKTTERITEALANNEQITVYGDYDADGMTSTALLIEILESLGAQVNYYLPSRFVEGYGPDIEAFKKIIEDGTSLIITVDNGVTGHEAIEFANNHGADVIVTDHHEMPDTLPEAYAIIHPKHPQGDYPFKDLAGVGVTLKLAHALIGELPLEMFDLAAIGTVADLVSLTDENRAIVYYGLQMIEQTQRFGLMQLLTIIEKKPAEVTEETIGFQIAPRLNAVGRLGEATPCVELLVTHDPDKAKELALYVNEQNEERKAIVNTMTAEVTERLQHKADESEVIVLADENWHQGVLGVVASRIVEKTNKPTLLFSIDSETNIAKGSARSVDGFNLYKALVENEELFTRFGGHYMAAGMSAKIEQLPKIQAKLSTHAQTKTKIEAKQTIDAYTSLEDITIETIQEIEQLRPFGTANKKPVIACQDVSVLQKRRVGAEGNHLKLLVGQATDQLDIISFQNGDISDLLFEQQDIAISGYVEINEWNGFTKPQMQMLDVDIPGPFLIDERMNELTAKQFEQEAVDYIFYNKNSYEKNRGYISESANAMLLSNLADAKNYLAKQNIIIVDCPTSIAHFQATVADNEQLTIRCYFYKSDHLFLDGLPSRREFGKVYKYFASHKDMDLKNKGQILAKHLKMSNKKIYLIVKVFLEANFVIIDSGLLNINKVPKKQNIKSTKAYQKAKQQIEAEELFIYSSFKEVITATSK